MPKGIYIRKPLTEKHKRNIQMALRGKHTSLLTQFRKGYKMSGEHKMKIGLANKGKPRWVNKPHPRSMLGKTPWNKGKKLGFVPKYAFKKGQFPWNKGMKMSEEFKEKARLRRLKQIFPIKDTSIEVKLQNFLKEQNIEFSTHYPILGQPDIFIKPNICIFADGCYWHKCPDCGFGHGREKDLQITKELQKQGYLVIRIWEHEINKIIW